MTARVSFWAAPIASVAVICSVAVYRDSLAQNSFGEATRQAPPEQPSQSAQPAPSHGQPPKQPAGGASAGTTHRTPAVGQSSSALDALTAAERQDLGVAPVSELHSG